MGSGGTLLESQRRIGVIGDVHTELDVLRWALATLREQHVDFVLATGDIADGPAAESGVTRCCALLREHGVHAVIGNHDRWLLDGEMRHLPDATAPEDLDAATRAYLRTLPATYEVKTPLGMMLFGHGVGADDMATLYPHDHGQALVDNTSLQAILRDGKYQLLCAGHTHRRMVRTIDGVIAINAGTLLRRRDPCCLVLDFEAREARFYDYAADGGTVTGPKFPL